MFNIVILGCKKTLVEYRGIVKRNRYYLRNPIRMGGLFSRNDFVQRLTRPEYFPIATSPQNPTTPPFLTIHLSQSKTSSYTSPPQFPSKNPTPQTSSSKFSPISPISPTLSQQSHLLSTLFPKIP